MWYRVYSKNRKHSTIKTNIGILSCGGWKDLNNDNNGNKKCWKLDTDNTWVPFPNMTVGRYFFAMGEAKNILVVIGGETTSNSMEWINLDEGKEWTRKNLSFPSYKSCLSKYNDTHLLLIGGFDVGYVCQ